MPVTVKLDLHGSTQTTGVSGSRYDRATRLCLVEGLTAADDITPPFHSNIDTAINAAIVAAGPFHHRLGLGPLQTPLSLQAARGRKWGPTKVWVTLIYARGRHHNVSDSVTQLMHSREEWESIPVYRYPFTGDGGTVSINSVGMPSGAMFENPAIGQLQDPKFRPRHFMWKRPITKFYIPTVLSFHPLIDVADLINHINLDQVTIGNIPFAANTLRFDGVDVDADQNSVGGNTFYFVKYSFAAIDTGFYRQFPVWDVNTTPNVWTTIDGLMHLRSNFTAAFSYSP